MKVKFEKQIGKNKLTIESSESAKPKEALFDLAFSFSFPGVSKCGECGSEYLDIQARKGKDKFKYVYLKCLKCGAELNFSERTEDGVVYFNKKENGHWDWKPKVTKGQ
jgi:DNA-directed RNA polymerase subunit RPC12/RpoP